MVRHLTPPGEVREDARELHPGGKIVNTHALRRRCRVMGGCLLGRKKKYDDVDLLMSYYEA